MHEPTARCAMREDAHRARVAQALEITSQPGCWGPQHDRITLDELGATLARVGGAICDDLCAIRLALQEIAAHLAAISKVDG